MAQPTLLEDFNLPVQDEPFMVATALCDLMNHLAGKSTRPTTALSNRVKGLLRLAEGDRRKLFIMVEYHHELTSGTSDSMYFSPGSLLSQDGYDRHFANAQEWDAKGRPAFRKKATLAGRNTAYEEKEGDGLTAEQKAVNAFRKRFFEEQGRAPTTEEVRAFGNTEHMVR